MSTIAPDQAPVSFPQPAPTGPQATAPSSPLAVSSLVLGLVSILAGWTFLAPLAGLITGILALGREPQARTMALWGIALNAVMLAGAVIVVLLALGFGLALLPFAFVF
ncbi:hypothetical protein RCH16_000556 [Cryobacterium sp. MP_M5]|uniref:DUF4190 domain-containing protein n=1 Tax=unclassified Cryobacterium TaxID=2649013 RepID=UPI001A1994C0|nr:MULTISPECIES: DUF4190 domain-containing protein [unclassified Cryobacterium]MBG6057364.1 hypothetical protein [Cryobacterium sp. MP_M3]MEC5175563.1 hypothetical protein [Cryobacterium sp. MP_M5]